MSVHSSLKPTLPLVHDDLLREVASYLTRVDISSMAQSSKFFAAKLLPILYQTITINALQTIANPISLTFDLCSAHPASYRDDRHRPKSPFTHPTKIDNMLCNVYARRRIQAKPESVTSRGPDIGLSCGRGRRQKEFIRHAFARDSLVTIVDAQLPNMRTAAYVCSVGIGHT
ncbi:hypothetical protein C8J55DRAFT_557912 [Lentinula edodes]|uniref:Uncharacterized protein n=1 Tax=Lentinula lateritia TaxID=40482 RepID=A0A9W9ATC1_9AGAR|nr:hypothetical protein C8J55DRAFT_557912 [Lentinula edodes]